MPRSLILYKIAITVINDEQYDAVTTNEVAKREMESIFSNKNFPCRFIEYSDEAIYLLYKTSNFLQFRSTELANNIIGDLKKRENKTFITALELRPFPLDQPKLTEIKNAFKALDIQIKIQNRESLLIENSHLFE